jgi:hypothetical protein
MQQISTQFEFDAFQNHQPKDADIGGLASLSISLASLQTHRRAEWVHAVNKMRAIEQYNAQRESKDYFSQPIHRPTSNYTTISIT